MQNYPLTSQINRARSEFFLDGVLPTKLVPEAILRSWQRCAAKGVEAGGKPDKGMLLSSNSLEDLSFQNRTFIESSRPIIENLYEQIHDTSTMVVLADKTGVILDTLGTIGFVDRVSRVFLQPGGVWSEEARGTNAVGTALFDQRPVRIFGGEHFAAANKYFSCSASPIFDPYGNLLGVLDVTSDCSTYHPHTLALVRISTQQIENQMFETGFQQDALFFFHTRCRFMGSPNVAVAVFTTTGYLKAANLIALHHLGLVRQHSGLVFSELFDIDFHLLLSQPGRKVEVTTRNGTKFFGEMRVPPASTYKTAPARTAIPPTTAQPAAKATLESLDLGDSMMRRAIEKARKVMGEEISILLEGESGTGKELFAQAVHNSGLRRNGHFVALNCAAIPEGLIESELFGYQEGAFTGARRGGSVGTIRQADGGTLFLDEIGDMPMTLQARLLRVLQERVVTPLGGGQAFPVDISVICATNRNLRKEIGAGRFREDLYYRLNGLVIRLPRLRDREDLLRLAYAMCAEITPARNIRIEDKVIAIMKIHQWPGNIRQLKSVLRTAVALLGTEEEILLEHLPEDFLDQYNESVSQQEEGPAPTATVIAHEPLSLDKLEKLAIKEALKECNNNLSAAARRLGISRKTLYRKLN